MEQHTTTRYEVEIKKLPGSRIEIRTSITAEEFGATRKKAIEHISEGVELPGFRKGHVPEKVILAKIGEGALLEEMAEIAISKAYPKIIVDEKIDALGRPEVHITKIAHGNPLEFTITTAVFPEIVLPDYKKIAGKVGKKKDAVIVTDEDVNKTIEQIRRMKGQQDAMRDKKEFDESLPLPEIDDAFVKTLGDFHSVDDLKNKLRENILKEKERAEEDKRRIAIMDAIADGTKVEIPDIIIEQETKRMEDELSADIARMGLDFEGYLKQVGKTKEEMHVAWRPDATKRAKIQMIIGKIADAEKLEPEPSVLERDVQELRARYPDAPEDRIRGYIHMLLTNEKVFTLLTAQSN